MHRTIRTTKGTIDQILGKSLPSRMASRLVLNLFALSLAATVGATGHQAQFLDSSAIQIYSRDYVVRPLPGSLDRTLVFNSNSPEVIRGEGVLLSTMPSKGKRHPKAHLNYVLRGRFDIFTHHIARGNPNREMYQGIVLQNPSPHPITVAIRQGISYTTSEDAPFFDLPPLLENSTGDIFSGPGSRAMLDALRGIRERNFPSQIEIPANGHYLILNEEIPRGAARTTFMQLYTDHSVYVANLAMYRSNRTPTLNDWRYLLQQGRLAQPRDRHPTALNAGHIIYGRVAGISQGGTWLGTVTDRQGTPYLTIPPVDQAIGYPISTVAAVTWGTKQVQSAPLIVRYADTALQAHGNYGVLYNLNFPLYNPTPLTQRVQLHIHTPFKHNETQKPLFFRVQPIGMVFFRGTVRVIQQNSLGLEESKYFHLHQREGEYGAPLTTVEIPPGRYRNVRLEFRYPPDATPPQVISVKTLPY
ncbi:MAG: DUF3370 domain-containing protein [Pseudanabaenaceae cyanobacterium]|jgi:hypothetical protein